MVEKIMHILDVILNSKKHEQRIVELEAKTRTYNSDLSTPFKLIGEIAAAVYDLKEKQEIRLDKMETLHDERLLNIEAAIKSVQIDFQAYCEKNPKHSDDWIEARLRALEHKVQGLELISIKDDENGQRPESYIQSNVKD